MRVNFYPSPLPTSRQSRKSSVDRSIPLPFYYILKRLQLSQYAAILKLVNRIFTLSVSLFTREHSRRNYYYHYYYDYVPPSAAIDKRGGDGGLPRIEDRVSPRGRRIRNNSLDRECISTHTHTHNRHKSFSNNGVSQPLVDVFPDGQWAVPLSTVCLAHGLQVSPDYVDPSSTRRIILIYRDSLCVRAFTIVWTMVTANESRRNFAAED